MWNINIVRTGRKDVLMKEREQLRMKGIRQPRKGCRNERKRTGIEMIYELKESNSK